MSIYDDLEISRRCPNCGENVADVDEELGYVIYFCGGLAIPGGDVEGCTGPANEEEAPMTDKLMIDITERGEDW